MLQGFPMDFSLSRRTNDRAPNLHSDTVWMGFGMLLNLFMKHHSPPRVIAHSTRDQPTCGLSEKSIYLRHLQGSPSSLQCTCFLSTVLSCLLPELMRLLVMIFYGLYWIHPLCNWGYCLGISWNGTPIQTLLEGEVTYVVQKLEIFEMCSYGSSTTCPPSLLHQSSHWTFVIEKELEQLRVSSPYIRAQAYLEHVHEHWKNSSQQFMGTTRMSWSGASLVGHIFKNFNYCTR